MVPMFGSYLTKVTALGAVAVLLCSLDYVLPVHADGAQMMLRFESSDKIADRSHDFTEVSGLSLSENGGFWAVSDNAPWLFRLDDAAKIRQQASLRAERGLEGVASFAAGGRILAVREDTSEILEVAQDGRITRHPLLEMEGAESLVAPFAQSDSNDGLEGITIDPETGTVFVIKEREPRLLIEIAPDFGHVRRIVPLTSAAGFVSEQAKDDRLDVSGLAWDGLRQGLWITSDTGKAIYFFDLATITARGWTLIRDSNGKSRRVSNAEGVALSADGQTIFVVTDDGKDSRLLTYRIN